MAQATCPKVPSAFATVREVLDGKHRLGTVVNVAGLVTDFRAPIQTRGNDWKCQIRLYDQSVADDCDDSLLLNIFWPADAMPDASCGDVIIVFAAKVQQFNSDPISLITTCNGSAKTAVHIYSAAKIPKPPSRGVGSLAVVKGATSRQPSKAENEFVSALYHSIDKGRVPDASEFKSMTATSVNIKDKFCELKDLQDGRFADTVVQIVREPYDAGDKISLWVSDYTENESFYHFSFSGGNVAGPVSDPYGYTANLLANAKQKPDWAGPFGKRSMQVTCFEPHASVIRNRQLSNGSWVSLRNLQIKFGRNGSNLEGYLREDRRARGVKINIAPLDVTRDPETISPQLRNAIRRKRDYEKAKKRQLENIAEAAIAGKRRRAATGSDAEPARPNAKARRKATRAQKNKESKQEEEATPIAIPDLNQQVKCENNSKPVSSVADILEPVYHKTTVDGEAVDLQLPFVNVNYRTNVRVVDFLPSDLKDFACPKKVSEFDVLSDNDESESESEPEQDMMTRFTTERAWEWRFFLELEDAVVKDGQQKRRIWVLVDNQAAQCLMDLDASDLRHDSKKLEALRQRLFLLWGDLEEHRSRAQKRARQAQHGRPPDHSSDNEARGSEEPRAQVANRPFSCCVRQYGVKIAEPDALRADAGNGRRWQRVFGLFGTRVTVV